jgi:transcriptional regulator with XRE-family HTH domain
MAKVKVRSRPGALWDLLKRKNMTQMKAAEKTGVDRKTLAKINRGEDVKEQIRRQVTTRLGVPEKVLDPAPTELAVFEPSWGVTVSKFDRERLKELLWNFDARPPEIHWFLNLQAVDEKQRELLEQLELAVHQLSQELFRHFEPDELHLNKYSLSSELSRLKTAEAVDTLLGKLVKQGIGVLGGDYLQWKVSESIEYKYHSDDPDDFDEVPLHEYTSKRIVQLSIEPYAIQSRRLPIWTGQEPPKSAPNAFTRVVVNGAPLETWNALTYGRKGT